MSVAGVDPVRWRFAITTWGTALRNCRMNMDLGFRAVADLAGVSKGMVRAWEHGEGYPDTVQLKRLYGLLKPLRRFENLLPVGKALPAEVSLPGSPPPVPVPAPQEIDEPRTFGAALKIARQIEGLMQHEVGDLLGVAQGTISRWELDADTPIQAHYDKLVELFEVLVDAPRPDGIRDIPKPIGPLGMKLGPPPVRGPTMTRELDPIRITALAVTTTDGSGVDAAGVAYARALLALAQARAASDQARIALAAAEGGIAAREADVARALAALQAATRGA